MVRSDLHLVEITRGPNPVKKLQDLAQYRDMFLLRITELVREREEQIRIAAVRETNNASQDQERIVDISDVDGEGNGTDGVGGESSQQSEIERENVRSEAERTKRKRKSVREEGIQVMMPYDMLRRLGPLFTQLQVSHNAAAKIVSAMYNEVGVDLDEVTVSAASSKRLRTKGNQYIAEKSLEDLTRTVNSRNIPLSAFVDSKKMKQRMYDEEGKLVRTELDRFAVVVDGPTLTRPHLVCMEGLEGGTAMEQAEATYASLCSFNLQSHVRDILYDTTASNTGRKGGLVRLLQLLMEGRACLCSPCRRHIAELLGKWATVGATGRRSTSPGDALFNRFRKAWPAISKDIDFGNLNDILNTLDWEVWENLPVAEAATKAREMVLDCRQRGLFQRNDQKFAADFILMKLGVRLQEGVTYTFPDLAEPSNARFLQRMLYFGEMDLLMRVPAVRALFTAEEQEVISRMSLFCTLFYGPYFLSTPIASRAATNDLDLIENLREFRVFDQEIADQALKVMDRHCDYLSPQLIPMVLADETLPAEVRQEFATALKTKLEEGVWHGEEYEVGENESPGPDFASGPLFWRNGRPPLSSFISDSSFLIFKVIGQQPEDLAWLGQPVTDWKDSNSYFDFEYYVKNKHVVNDAVERAIGTMKPIVGNFKKEENLQAAVKTIEKTREAYPSSKLKGVVRGQMLKTDLKKIRPSELLPEDGEVLEPQEESDGDSEDREDVFENEDSSNDSNDPDVSEPPPVDSLDI